mgnify:CR=1
MFTLTITTKALQRCRRLVRSKDGRCYQHRAKSTHGAAVKGRA